MKLLIVGAGSVGTSTAQIIKRAGRGSEWAEKVVIVDYNLVRMAVRALG
jgi:2-polyprenyl-6-methoxyphenol hydroxylase-like FAD-dependent oxidoreductase